MAIPINKKPRRKGRYRKLSFKLSHVQIRQLDRFCRLENTTHNKLIKMALREYFQRNEHRLPDEDYVSENQLMLFDPYAEPKQMEMFEDIEDE